jgi:hypothetical protein
MKQKLMLLLLLFPAALLAQDAVKYNIVFKKDKDTIKRGNDDKNLKLVELTYSNTDNDAFKNHKLYVEVDESKTTLPKGQYSILTTINGDSLKNLKADKNYVMLNIEKDDPKDKQVKDLKLVLRLIVKKKVKDKEEEDKDNEGKTTEITLIIKPVQQPLDNYRYLGYLGTNFDMVDGVQANKLYFAVNILLPETKKYGINIGVYGNRTMTQTDTSSFTTFTSRIEAYGRDSVVYLRDTAVKITSRVSDNIGAFFSPLIPIKFLTDDKLKFYYAPSIEFIWRRSKIESKFTNNGTYKRDTASNRFPAGFVLPLVTPLSSKYSQNIYDIYCGVLGLMFLYETDDISIRLSSAMGVNFNYVPVGGLSSTSIVYQQTSNICYQGRLFITEPTTGFTLGAEISNLFGKFKDPPHYSKAQPYYNVTLSKAFNLKNLATIVKPLSKD